MEGNWKANLGFVVPGQPGVTELLGEVNNGKWKEVVHRNEEAEIKSKWWP